jgi:hypothetical protein
VLERMGAIPRVGTGLIQGRPRSGGTEARDFHVSCTLPTDPHESYARWTVDREPRLPSLQPPLAPSLTRCLAGTATADDDQRNAVDVPRRTPGLRALHNHSEHHSAFSAFSAASRLSKLSRPRAQVCVPRCLYPGVC